MPIRRELYPPDWPAISRRIRFDRAGGRCERCGRHHGEMVPGYRPGRITVVVLTTAHLDHDPAHNDDANLAALCCRCHLEHDRPHHLANRRRTIRSRWALADLFVGPYEPPPHPARQGGEARDVADQGLAAT
jgi:hypothetical protein